MTTPLPPPPPNEEQAVLAVLAVRNKGWHRMFDKLAKLQADKEVVLAAVTNCGRALEYASEALRFDKEVVLALSTRPLDLPIARPLRPPQQHIHISWCSLPAWCKHRPHLNLIIFCTSWVLRRVCPPSIPLSQQSGLTWARLVDLTFLQHSRCTLT